MDSILYVFILLDKQFKPRNIKSFFLLGLEHPMDPPFAGMTCSLSSWFGNVIPAQTGIQPLWFSSIRRRRSGSGKIGAGAFF